MRSSRRALHPILISLMVALVLASCMPVSGADVQSGQITATVATAASTPEPATRTPKPTRTPPAPSPTLRATLTGTPTITPTASPTSCPHPEGSIEQGEIFSIILNRPLYFQVFLPPCYDRLQPGGYPVLYLLHGQGMDESGWTLLGASQAAARLIASGEVNPFLMVMPREDYYLQDMTQSGFGWALLEDLLPWIETHYTVCSQRSCRAIGGLSRGATWAMMIAMEHLGLFRAAGAHSLPNAVFSPYYLQLLWEAQPADERTRLYLDIGEYDRYRPGAEEFQQRLEFLQIPHEWHLNPGSHDDTYWIAHVEDYLRWYAEDW
jgi:enterochelin esterase-like enzyme